MHVRQARLALGRGYSSYLEAVERVEPQLDGTLLVEATGRYAAAGSWTLTVDLAHPRRDQADATQILESIDGGGATQETYLGRDR